MVAAVLLLLLAGLKLVFTPGLGHRSLDGNFYYQIARNVTEGEGLVTNVSIYHQGLEELPHPTNQNPLWPLVLGYSGRLLGLETAAVILPKLFYLLSLVLLYVLANRVARELTGRMDGDRVLADGSVLDYGHLAMLLFGLNPIYFRFTSLPYTEGLAFLLLFGVWWIGAAAARSGRSDLALAAGILAGCAFVTRSQLIGVPVSLLAILAWWCRPASENRWRPLVAAGVGLLAPIAVWVGYLVRWVEPFRVDVMMGVGNYRETSELVGYTMRVGADSWWEWWRNRLGGLLTAFDPASENSYVSSFGAASWLVPLTLVLLCLVLVGGRRPVASLPGRGPLTYLGAALTVSLLAPLHTMHFSFFKEWLFGWRHGLPMILAIVLAMPITLGLAHRYVRWLAAGLVVASLLTGSAAVARLLSTDFRPGLTAAEQQLVAWLERHSSEGPVAITTRAQTLAVFSRAGFHWTQCDDTAEQTQILLNETSARYVVAYGTETRCPFLADLRPRLEVVEVFGESPYSISLFELADTSREPDDGSNPRAMDPDA